MSRVRAKWGFGLQARLASAYGGRMPSARRDERPGLHHVWCRGNNRRAIVLDDRDRLDLLARTARAAQLFRWKIVAYCLMENHYHVVLEIGERGMSAGFCRVHTGYATSFNDRHGRVNHLFGRRFGSRPIEDGDDLFATCRYVLLNPVRAGVVATPEEYDWSSYRATIGIAPADLPLEVDPLLASFHPRRPRAQELVAEFCGAIHPRLERPRA
jgi:REP-associated tyrosine transposase